MILSAAELEIAEESAGILVLDDGAAPGTPLAEVLPLAEPVLELEVTPNRVDCFGVYGVAARCTRSAPRRSRPSRGRRTRRPRARARPATTPRSTVEVPELCPRFTARVFTDVEIGPSPAWLQARLSAAGQRPINNVVDITNYVMLLTAQPLHAFDLDKVPDGALTVRAARRGGEDDDARRRRAQLRRRDGAGLRQRRPLRDRRDHGRPGLRGLGGDDAGAARGRQLERDQHPAHLAPARPALGGLLALREAAPPGALHAGAADRLAADGRALRGEAGARARSTSPPRSRRRRGSALRGERVEGLLGMRIEQADQVAYLERLGFGVEAEGEDLVVEVPPDRHYDVTREVDLIEEVARVHGLDEHLPSTLPGAAGQAGGLRRDQRLRRRAEDALRDLGFDEIVGWSFTDPGEAERLRIPAEDPRAEGVTISNSLSEDQSVMRTTLIGSLLGAAQRNLARGADRVALFESGRVYLPPAADGLEPGRRWPGGSRGSGRRRSPSRTGRLPRGRALVPNSWRARRAGRFLRAQGRAGRHWPAGSASASSFEPAPGALSAPRGRGRESCPRGDRRAG